MPELIEPGATGELVPANDPHALAVALTPYLRDPGHAFSMRDRARATIVSNFSPERHLERISATYALAARTLQQRAA
jgi:mannosyltransferase